MLTLRGYRAEDLDALYALDVVCFDPVFRFSRAAMRRFATAPNARVVIAHSGDALIGFAIAHVEPGSHAPVGYLVTLDVAPAHRRHGVAKTLLAACEIQCSAAGCTAIMLHVHTGNTAAIRFYQSVGFECLGVDKNFYGIGIDAGLWRKPLRLGQAPSRAS